LSIVFPKYVQNAFIQAAKFHEKSRKYQNEFEDWIKKNYGEKAILDDGVRDAIIDCVEQSNDPETAMEDIKEVIEEELLDKS